MNEQNNLCVNTSFPSTVFPNLPEWKHDKKRKLGLDGYGSWEAIDIHVEEDCEIAYAKKSRICSLLPEVKSTVLTPCRDQDVLCKENSEGDCDLSKDIATTKELIPKVFDHNFRCAVLPIEQKFLHSMEASHKVLTQEFKHFLKTNSADPYLRKWMKRRLKSGFQDEKLLRHFDPTCLGIGKKLFGDLLQENYKKSLANHFNEGGAVGGGCLSYRHLLKSSDGNFGFIICAEGHGMYELGFKAIFTNSGIDYPQSSYSDEFRNLNVEVCGEIAQTLQGKIHNIDSMSGDDGVICISAMSDYHVLFNTLHGNKITFDWEEKNAKFSKKSLCSSLLKTSRCTTFSSAVLSPYIHGECVVATKSGLTGLWQADKQHYCDVSKSVLQLNVNFNKEKICLKHVSFGAHPRQFFGCDQSCVYLFDIRSQNSPSCLFDAKNSSYLVKPEHIHASQSCRSIGNEYEIVVATDNNIFVIDQRYCNEPLLKWNAISDFPACYLKCVSAPYKASHASIAGSKCQFSNSLLLAGGMTTDKVYYYQMSRLGKCVNDMQYSCAPFSAAPPRILCQSPTVYSDCNSMLKYSMPERNRLKHVISGFDGLTFEGPKSSGVCIFQLTSNGEIFYQTLDGNRDNGDEFRNSHRLWKCDSRETTDHDSLNTSHNCPQSPSRLLSSFSVINWCLSDYETNHCAICVSRLEGESIYNGAESSLSSAESCKHCSTMGGSILNHGITDNYFHNPGRISELNLINLDVPNDQSELGKMLLKTWDELDE